MALYLPPADDAAAQASDAAAVAAQLDQKLKDAAQANTKLEKEKAAVAKEQQQLETAGGGGKAAGDAEVTPRPSAARGVAALF